MKKPNLKIFAVIIREPSSYARKELLGRELGEYVLRGIAPIEYIETQCAKEVVFPPKYTNLAVLYGDMPLVTADILYEVAALMQTRGVKKIGLGRGYMQVREASVDEVCATGLNICDFLSVNDTNGYKIVYNELNKRIIARATAQGAQILGDEAVIDDTVVFEQGATVEGSSRIIGNSLLRTGARVISSRIENAEIPENQIVGPYSYVRGARK